MSLLISPLSPIVFELIHKFAQGINLLTIGRQRTKGGRPRQKNDWAIATGSDNHSKELFKCPPIPNIMSLTIGDGEASVIADKIGNFR
jgi:hypothetical protein